MEIISVLKREKWNELVKSFSEWDVYYLMGITNCQYRRRDI